MRFELEKGGAADEQEGKLRREGEETSLPMDGPKEDQARKEEEKGEEGKLQEGERDLRLLTLSTTAPATKESSLPDLALTEIFLKKKRRLFATLVNVGNAPFPMDQGGLSLFLDGRLEGRYALKSLTDHLWLQPNGKLTLPIPISIFGRKEVEVRVETSTEQGEKNPENNALRKVLEGAPKGPDLIVQDFDLNEDLELMIYLSNSGELDLRRGGTFKVRIYLNDRKISEFEHFVSDELKANSRNPYLLMPPFRVPIRGVARVKVSVSPKSRMDDVRHENNVLERRFIIFPFQIEGKEREQFSFFIPQASSKEDDDGGKIKVEVRWEGPPTPLKVSLENLERGGVRFDLSGTSPVKIEWPIPSGPGGSESRWRASLHNLHEGRVEGYFIVQHP
ncbi:MAG: hypothetical protein N3G78_00200 [Desulfobacterota bacterium]|nr:hypothetical protein [Thermodesulfobacteriota bacterium]